MLKDSSQYITIFLQKDDLPKSLKLNNNRKKEMQKLKMIIFKINSKIQKTAVLFITIFNIETSQSTYSLNFFQKYIISLKGLLGSFQ